MAIAALGQLSGRRHAQGARLVLEVLVRAETAPITAAPIKAVEMLMHETTMNVAAKEAGIEDYDHGQDPVAYELQRQLEERCDDDVNDGYVGTMISYGFHECGECRPSAGAETLRVDTAEAVWRWWEEAKTGPFREGGEA